MLLRQLKRSISSIGFMSNGIFQDQTCGVFAPIGWFLPLRIAPGTALHVELEPLTL